MSDPESDPGPTAGSAVGTPPDRRSGHVQSVERAIRLLRAVAAGSDTTVAGLAATCALNRATAWRLLTTLEGEGMVECERSTGRWSVGLAALEVAGTAGAEALVRAAHGVLEKVSMQTGETAALAFYRGGRLTYLDEAAPPAVVAATWKGRTVPLHATSTGKVLLAFGPPEAVPETLSQHTDTTVTDPEALRAELEEIRQSGYATCRGEFESSAYGVSAPILDNAGHALAVLSIWGPRDRLTEDRFAALGEVAVAAVSEIPRPAAW